MKKVLHSFHSQLPGLSDSERDMKKELQLIPDQLRHLGNAIKQVGMDTRWLHLVGTFQSVPSTENNFVKCKKNRLK